MQKGSCGKCGESFMYCACDDNPLSQEKVTLTENQISNAKEDALAAMSFHRCSSDAAQAVADIFDSLLS